MTVVPAQTPADDIIALEPDGVFLSNGPGDPAATGSYAVPIIRQVIERGIPTFGICLGHQMLGIAVGGRTRKMHQGHHGANHPVKDLTTGKVEITSMNHGFALETESLPQHVRETQYLCSTVQIAGSHSATGPCSRFNITPRRPRARTTATICSVTLST